MPTENEKQLTAVQIVLEYCERENWSVAKSVQEQALATEREQLIDAVKYGHNDAHKVNSDLSFEEYYSQTFKTQ
jgi:hypothetical protein